MPNSTESRTSLLALGLLIFAHGASAQTCDVPGDRASVQMAVDDSGCSTVTLSAPSIAENVSITRSVDIRGTGVSQNRIIGQVQVTGAAVTVTLSNLWIDTSGPFLSGCFSEALWVFGDAAVAAADVRVSNADGAGTCDFRDEVFSNGFE